MTFLRILRSGALTSLQDGGRQGHLSVGIGESGPMDFAAFSRAGQCLGACAETGIEFAGGLSLEVVQGPIAIGFDGGDFALKINGKLRSWPARAVLRDGDRVDISPGSRGNYGYLRFDREPDVAPLLGSRSTNTVARLGGRLFADGDELHFGAAIERHGGGHPRAVPPAEGPMRVIWGSHAELFDRQARARFVEADFAVSSGMDRMGVRLVDRAGVFRDQRMLTLVSDAIVAGDIQVLGDGTPTVLMRDHQPTGGYPRIATVVSADLDRFAQLRPGAIVRFEPVTVKHAQSLSR